MRHPEPTVGGELAIGNMPDAGREKDEADGGVREGLGTDGTKRGGGKGGTTVESVSCIGKKKNSDRLGGGLKALGKNEGRRGDRLFGCCCATDEKKGGGE